MYRVFALIPPKSDLTIKTLLSQVETEFATSSVTLNGNQITISRGEWDFELLEQSGPEVLAESSDIAEKMAGQAEDSDVAACDRRIDAWSETPDPMLEYFEDYQRVVGLLKSFPDLIVIDPTEPSFL
ncbi:hypothetical protein [Limnoglobus roseus]|uniref:Uncharacterized protein n=1 Tax=Limnoglobus roseus TaxID=2598579 RepID=A0A5C1AMG6_9BACT|nr:hypothetical protein [Limnoglobus roseus]QEL18922.1 hypothetical protein PX52LOC_05972 [Limnoglobus roseus]